MHVKQQNVTPRSHFKLNVSIASRYEQLRDLQKTLSGNTRLMAETACLVIPEAIGAFKIGR